MTKLVPATYSHDVDVALGKKKLSSNDRSKFFPEVASYMLSFKLHVKIIPVLPGQLELNILS